MEQMQLRDNQPSIGMLSIGGVKPTTTSATFGPRMIAGPNINVGHRQLAATKHHQQQQQPQQQQVKSLVLIDRNGHLRDGHNQRVIGPTRDPDSENSNSLSLSSNSLNQLLRLNQLKLSDENSGHLRQRGTNPNLNSNLNSNSNQSANSKTRDRLKALASFSFVASPVRPMEAASNQAASQSMLATEHAGHHLQHQQQQHQHQQAPLGAHQHTDQSSGAVMRHNETDQQQQQQQQWPAAGHFHHNYWPATNQCEMTIHHHEQQHQADFAHEQTHLNYQQQALGGPHMQAEHHHHDSDFFINEPPPIDSDPYLHQEPHLIELDGNNNINSTHQHHHHHDQQQQRPAQHPAGQPEYADLDAQQRHEQAAALLPESVAKANDQLASCSFGSSTCGSGRVLLSRQQQRQDQHFASSYRSDGDFSQLNESYSTASTNRPTNVITCAHCSPSSLSNYGHLSHSMVADDFSASYSSSHQQLPVCQHHHQQEHRAGINSTGTSAGAASATGAATATSAAADVRSTSLDSSASATTDSAASSAKEEPELKVCEWRGCCSTFLEMADFVRHLEERHVNLEPKEKNKYYCLWANCKRNEQEFNARYKLLIHMRVHSGEKPYPCKLGQCPKSFSRLENLKIHQRSHTGDKPYRCKNYPTCGKSFTNSSDRIKHHKTHQNPKPYQCTQGGCEKKYTDPSSLRKHLRAHKRHVQHQPGGAPYDQHQAQVGRRRPINGACCLPTADYDPAADFNLNASTGHQPDGTPTGTTSTSAVTFAADNSFVPGQEPSWGQQGGGPGYCEPQPDNRWQQHHNQYSQSWAGPGCAGDPRPAWRQPRGASQHSDWSCAAQQPPSTTTAAAAYQHPAARPTEAALSRRHEQLMRSMPSQTSGLARSIHHRPAVYNWTPLS